MPSPLRPHTQYPHLDREFLQLMEEMMAYGALKHGHQAYDQVPERHERIETESIKLHAGTHFREYISGVPHDHFCTLAHQLAAAAVNPMMEFVLARREGKV